MQRNIFTRVIFVLIAIVLLSGCKTNEHEEVTPVEKNEKVEKDKRDEKEEQERKEEKESDDTYILDTDAMTQEVGEILEHDDGTEEELLMYAVNDWMKIRTGFTLQLFEVRISKYTNVDKSIQSKYRMAYQPEKEEQYFLEVSYVLHNDTEYTLGMLEVDYVRKELGNVFKDEDDLYLGMLDTTYSGKTSFGQMIYFMDEEEVDMMNGKLRLEFNPVQKTDEGENFIEALSLEVDFSEGTIKELK